MLIPVWWRKADDKTKERAIRVLNGQAFSLGSVHFNGMAEWEQFRRGLLFADDLRRFMQKMREQDEPLQEQREQLEAIRKWQSGAPLPHDIRRCRYERCRRFCLVRKSRPGRVFHSSKCGRNYRAAKCMRERVRQTRERKLKRVRAALKMFRHLPDWRERTASKARVTVNFVSYAIRRGEL